MANSDRHSETKLTELKLRGLLLLFARMYWA